MYKTKPQVNGKIFIMHFSGSYALFPVNMLKIWFIVPVLYRILREFGKVVNLNLARHAYNRKILHKSDSGQYNC